jgi:NADPH:quinone reductase
MLPAPRGLVFGRLGPAGALAKGLDMIAAQIRPELTIAGPLESVAAIHDLLAAGRGSGKYITKVHG